MGRHLRNKGEVVSTEILFDEASTMWHLGAVHSLRYFLSLVTHGKQISYSKYDVTSKAIRKE